MCVCVGEISRTHSMNVGGGAFCLIDLFCVAGWMRTKAGNIKENKISIKMSIKMRTPESLVGKTQISVRTVSGEFLTSKQSNIESLSSPLSFVLFSPIKAPLL